MPVVVVDSGGVVLSTPLRVEVQLWVLDEGTTQMMLLLAMALTRAVKQWAQVDWVEVVTPVNWVVQMCMLDEGEMCAISLEVATPRRRMVELCAPPGVVIMSSMTGAQWWKSPAEREISCYFVIWNWCLGWYKDFYHAKTAAEDGQVMTSRNCGCQVD